MSTNLIKLVCWIDAYIHFPVRRLWNFHFMTTFSLISHCFIFLIKLYGYPISLWLSFRLKAIKLILIPSSNISKYFGLIYRISIDSKFTTFWNRSSITSNREWSLKWIHHDEATHISIFKIFFKKKIPSGPKWKYSHLMVCPICYYRIFFVKKLLIGTFPSSSMRIWLFK